MVECLHHVVQPTLHTCTSLGVRSSGWTREALSITAIRQLVLSCSLHRLVAQANVVLDTIVAMFSELCAEPFTAEPVNILYEATNETDTTPKLSSRQETASLARLRGILGVELPVQEICELCAKMQLGPAVHDSENDAVLVTVPPTRSDVLHAIDVFEDVAIAYGYNNLPLKLPGGYTVGRPDPLNAFSDLLR